MSEMSVKEAYRVLQAACGIEVGDTIKVVRKDPNPHFLGCRNSWQPPMDKMVGQTSIVSEILDDAGGICLYDTYYYPFYCLDLVKKAKPKPPPIMVGEHEVEFLDGKIKVCDVTVSKETLKQILERLEN